MPRIDPGLYGMRIAVFSRDPQEVDGLSEYLLRLGAVPTCCAKLGQALPRHVDVSVVFCGDFPAAEVVQLLRTAPGPGESKALVLVTSSPEVALLSSSSGPIRRRVMFLRAPLRGGALVEAIHHCVGAPQAEQRS